MKNEDWIAAFLAYVIQFGVSRAALVAAASESRAFRWR
jgi:hypothetical protein